MTLDSHSFNRQAIAMCLERAGGDWRPSTATSSEHAKPYTKRHTRLAAQSKQRFLRLMPSLEYQAAAEGFFDQEDWLCMAEMSISEIQDMADDFVHVERQRCLDDDEQREFVL